LRGGRTAKKRKTRRQEGQKKSAKRKRKLWGIKIVRYVAASCFKAIPEHESRKINGESSRATWTSQTKPGNGRRRK